MRRDRTASFLALALCAAAVVAAPVPAVAQHPCPGHISATALRPLPPGASFGVALSSDDELQLALRDHVLAALRGAGLRVADPPSHVLSWRGGLSRNGVDAAPRSLYGPEDSFRDSDDLRWMQDVPRIRRRPSAQPVRLNAVVELRERESSRVVWTAVISCARQGGDRAALMATLTGAVIPLIGRSAAGQPF
jgi:hypothetical protein